MLSFRVGQFPKFGTGINPNAATPEAAQNQPAITGVGFSPKALILFSSGSNSDVTNIMRPGFGIAAGGGTQNRSISWGSDDAQDVSQAASPTNAFRRSSEEYCFTIGSGGSTQYPKAKVFSFDTDGFTLTYDMNDTNTYDIQYIAIGGSDISKAKVGSFNLRTTTGNQDIGPGKFTRLIWTSTRTGPVQRDLANNILNQNDWLVYHIGPGATMATQYIDAMNAVTTVPNSHKGIECFSLADINANIATAVSNGWGFVSYDLEGTVPAEDADPIGSFNTAYNTVVTTNGLKLHSALSHGHTTTDANVDAIAPLLEFWHLQSQPKQGDDDTGTIMDDWIRGRVTRIKAANANCIVSYQVTLTDITAPNDEIAAIDEGTIEDIYATARRCINLTSSNTGTDAPQGLSVWWGGNDFNNHRFQNLTGYHESKFGGITFQPDFLMFFGANTIPQIAVGTTGSDPGASWYLGATAPNTANSQTVISNISLDAIGGVAPIPNHAARYQRAGSGGSCIAIFDENTAPASLGTASEMWAEASFVTSLPQGFRINVTNAPPSTTEAAERPIFYLAIQGGRWNTGAFNAPTSGGSQTVTGTPAIASYTPRGVMLFSDQDLARTTINLDSHKFSIGASDATPNQWTCLGGDDNAPDTTITETVRGRLTGAIFRSNRIEPTPNAMTDISSSAGLSSVGSGQFVLNWTVADASARQLLFITAGDSPPGAALVKIPTADPVAITEGLVRKRTLIRKPTVAEPIGISEAVLRRRGIVKVVGGPAAAATGGGFTSEGFLSSGFVTGVVTPSGPGPDYISADFVDTDYLTDATAGAPTGTEFIGISESVVKKLLAAADEWVTPEKLILVYSGGSSYNGAGIGAPGSLGGAVSSVTVASGVENSAWDPVLGAEASAGRTEFRCFYLKNTHSSLTAYNVRIWISLNTTGPDRIEMAVGSALVNNVEPAVASETTDPTTPNGVAFSTAPNENGSLLVGDLPPSGYRAIWIKRIVDASTTSFLDDRYEISVAVYSSHA